MVKWKSGSHAFKMEIIYGRQSPQPFVPPPLAAHLHFRQLTKDPTKDNASSKNKPSELSYELMHVALGDFVILNLQDRLGYNRDLYALISFCAEKWLLNSFGDPTWGRSASRQVNRSFCTI